MKRFISMVLFLINSAQAAPLNGLVAHEWGTFTSLQDSQGKTQEGLHHEDESLPGFVHSRVNVAGNIAAAGGQSCRICKGDNCCSLPGFLHETGAYIPRGVTQKMETPVIYFYSKTPQNLQVSVDFPQGLISQWYPAVQSFKPDLNGNQQLSGGSLTWQVQLSTEKLEIPKVAPTSIWQPSREVAANFLTANGENERLLFYRGLGSFEMPVKIKNHGDQITITNSGEENIPSATLLYNDGQTGSVVYVGEIKAGATKTVDFRSLQKTSMENYLKGARGTIHKSLANSGLKDDESWAMVNTWSHSYFKTEGLRLLYVLPRAWTDKLLPLSITPTPDALVRTLVGRVEILTESEEKSLLDNLKNAENSGKFDKTHLGRFAEAKLRRVRELTDSKSLRLFIDKLIADLNS